MKEKIKQAISRLVANLRKVILFLKKWWTHVVNFVVLFLAYATIDEGSWSGLIIGLWVFVLLAYYLFWKIFGAETLFKNND